MVKISRNQLNINNFKADMKNLFESIKDLLASFDYDAGDSKYKYHGKPEEIKEVQFNIVGEKNVDNYVQFLIEVEVNVVKAKPVIEKVIVNKEIFDKILSDIHEREETLSQVKIKHYTDPFNN